MDLNPIEDLAKLDADFDWRKVPDGVWELFLSVYRRLFWRRNATSGTQVIETQDMLVEQEKIKGQGISNGGKHTTSKPASK